MLQLNGNKAVLVGASGSLPIADDDEVTRKLAMIVEGECEGLGATAAALKYGYSRARYYQLLEQFKTHGAQIFQSLPRGPKRNYRRTDELVRQVIRHRFLDPEASAAVITQKLLQSKQPLSMRSVERVIADYGLQKKTLHTQSQNPRSAGAHTAHPTQTTRGGRRSKEP